MKFLTQEHLIRQVAKFNFEGTFAGVLSYGSGHINDTYAAYFKQQDQSVRRYILQRVNRNVFKNPREVMANVLGVTQYLRGRIAKLGGDPLRETLNLILTHDGRPYDIDEEGDCWRAYIFIEDTISFQLAESREIFYRSARAFGKFAMLLADYPADTLFETIPLFHNTVDRMRQLCEAVAADGCSRAKTVQKEIDFVLAREKFTHLLVDCLAAKELPLRVTHNDTKLNNVLMDAKTGEGVCIIDLDTVMPGLTLYDFGDSIRFGASTAAEDERDLTKVHFDLELFACYTKGYLEEAGSAMTQKEIALLPEGAKMMTLECGIRFLTDHLAGDTYFKIHRENHNLDRARTQFQLVAEMEENWDAMHEIVAKYAQSTK